jgi:hypothetical protein
LTFAGLLIELLYRALATLLRPWRGWIALKGGPGD